MPACSGGPRKGRRVREKTRYLLWGATGSMKMYTWPLGAGPQGKKSSVWKEWEEIHQLEKRGHSRQRDPQERRLGGCKCLERSAYGKRDVHHRVVTGRMTGDVAEKASGPAWPKAVATVEELDFLLCVKGVSWCFWSKSTGFLKRTSGSGAEYILEREISGCGRWVWRPLQQFR